MKENACFFTGHRKIAAANEKTVRRAVLCAALDMINRGVCDFIAGGAVGFDMLAAEAVAELKSDYGITLRLFLPCRGHERRWEQHNKERLAVLIECADEVRYVSDSYHRGCMRLRNEAMVLEARYCIAWSEGRPGGTTQTLSIAKKCGCEIRNLAVEPW